MSVTYAQAFTAEEFHLSHAGQPCTVWQRAGQAHAMGTTDRQIPGWPTDGGFFVAVEHWTERYGMPHREWWHITGVNAGDFHMPEDCPAARSDRSDTGNPGQPKLSAGGYDADGYDADGYDADGYDADGYDADGYDADGYDADGYDADGLDRDGYTRLQTQDSGDLDLSAEWNWFRASSRFLSDCAKQEEFTDHLREIVRDPGAIDDVAFCGNCGRPEWDDDLNSVRGGELSICGSCWSDWTSCDYCEDRYPLNDLTTALGGDDLCDGCRSSYYSYCDDCNGYYRDEDSDDHDHDSGCWSCDSPQPEFTIRNDGCEPLRNDTRITVELPAGTISAEGLAEIRYYLLGQDLHDVAYDLEKLGNAWQATAGNFTKRLSRMAYTDHQVKLTPEVMSRVGCIARDHSNSVSTEIEITRDLNQDADYFYHVSSCWWTDESQSRCALKTNGGFGLRSFDGYDVNGRAWVLPLRQAEDGSLVPTFETMTPDAFTVFNGYGKLNGYSAPRIIAHMAGWTYRKIEFKCDPMYVNSGGYLVAAEEIAKRYTDGSLHLSVSQHASLYATEQRELVNA